MAFNYAKLLDLHRKSGERMRDFTVDIFPEGSKLGISYFNKDKISSDHLELICKHYNVPMDYFFDDMPHPAPMTHSSIVSNNQVGDGNVNMVNTLDTLKMANEELKKDIEWYRNRIEWLENLIKEIKK